MITKCVVLIYTFQLVSTSHKAFLVVVYAIVPNLADEKIDGIEEESTLISRAVSRRDMATQMSPDGSTHSSPREGLSFSSSPLSFLPKVDPDSFHSSKLEVRDVQVDDRVTMTRWSRKHGARGPEKGFANVEDIKKKSMETRASTYDVSDASKCMAKYLFFALYLVMFNLVTQICSCLFYYLVMFLVFKIIAALQCTSLAL